MTIRAVNARIDYSLTVICQHFVNKDGVRLALLRRGYAQLAQDLAAADPSEATAIDRISTLAHAYFDSPPATAPCTTSCTGCQASPSAPSWFRLKYTPLLCA